MASDQTKGDNPAEAKKLDATSLANAESGASKRLSEVYMDDLFRNKDGGDKSKKPAEQNSPFLDELQLVDRNKPTVERTAAAGALEPPVKPGSTKPEDQKKPDQSKPEATPQKPEPNKATDKSQTPPKPETQPKPQSQTKPETQTPKPETQPKPGQTPAHPRPGQTPGAEAHPLPGQAPGSERQPRPEIVPQPGVIPQVRPDQLPQGDARPQPQRQIDLPPALPMGDAPAAVHLGAHDYQVGFGQDGRTNSLTLSDATGTVQMTRDAQGHLVLTNATGAYAPNQGLIHLEGIPIVVNPDGTIKGDLSFDGKGGAQYKTDSTPDANRFDLKPDGTLVAYDMKNWKRITFTPDGHSQETYWDGYEWRNGQLSADGTRVDFDQEAGKPTFIQRDFSNGQNKSVIGFPDGTTFGCDFNRHSIVENIPGPDGQPGQTVNLFYNGAGYYEASQVNNDQPQPGDTTVTFKDPQSGEPSAAILHSDGTVTTVRPDNTMVTKDAYGYVTDIAGPRGNWQFKRDVNGDIVQFYHQHAGPDGNVVNDVMTRQGFEQNPGMNYWYSYDGLNSPRPANDTPPWDPDHPNGYDVFVDQNGRSVNMNIYVTADGTVREAVVGADQQPVITLERPGQDALQDNGTQLISQHPGGVTETINKQTNEHVYQFSRAGQDYTLSSTNGDLQVMADGTVIQDHAAQQTRDYYFPNGVQATIGGDGGNPPKPQCKQVVMPNPGGQPILMRNGENGVSDLNVLDGGLVAATLTGADGKAVPTVFSPQDGTKSEKAPNENFWRVSNRDGSFVGTAANPAQPVWKVGNAGVSGPAGNNYDATKWAPAQPPIGANGEMLLVGTGDNTGASATLSLNGIAVEKKGTSELYKYPDKSQAVVEAGQLKSMLLNNNQFSPEFAAGSSGEGAVITGLSDGKGNHLTPLPSGAAYHFDRASGKFTSEASTNNGVQTVTSWDPGSNTFTVQRAWQTSTGQVTSSSFTLNDQNQVLQFMLPGDSQPVAVSGNASLRGASFDLSTGAFNMAMTNGMQGQFNADGSYDWLNAGQNVNQASHFNRDGALVPSSAQGQALGSEVTALANAADDASYQKFATDLLGRFAGNASAAAAMDSFVKDLNQNYLSQLNPPAAITAQLASGNQVTLTVQIGTGTSAKTKTITYQIPTA